MALAAAKSAVGAACISFASCLLIACEAVLVSNSGDDWTVGSWTVVCGGGAGFGVPMVCSLSRGAAHAARIAATISTHPRGDIFFIGLSHLRANKRPLRR
jgi:hypothetical protein